MTVNDIERLEHFAIMSGLAPQSVDAIRPDFPRWVRYMKENGVTEIPDSPVAGHSHAVNMASWLIRQKAGFKGDSITQELRNLTGIRPWKLWLCSPGMGPVSGPHDDIVWKPVVHLVEERLSLLTVSRKSVVFADQTAYEFVLGGAL
jgi:hypothetical protein